MGSGHGQRDAQRAQCARTVACACANEGQMPEVTQVIDWSIAHLLEDGILDGGFECQDNVRRPARPKASDTFLSHNGRNGFRRANVAPGLYSYKHALDGDGCAEVGELGNIAGRALHQSRGHT